MSTEAIKSAVKHLDGMSGWRLLLYTILGVWVLGAATEGVARIIHGPADYSGLLKALAQGNATPPVNVTAAPPSVKVSGIPNEAIDALAAQLEAEHGPIPIVSGVDGIELEGGIDVGSALPVVLGVALAAALAGCAALWAKHHGLPTSVSAHLDKPVQVAPVDVKVTPQLPPQLQPALAQAQKAVTPDVPDIMQTLATLAASAAKV